MRKRTMRLTVMAGVLSAALAVGVFPAQATGFGGNEGCTPGYWKVDQHFDSWEEYTPGQKIKDLFGPVNSFPAELSWIYDTTMLKALKGKGGETLSGAAEILLRASVAAFLNAAHDSVNFAYRRFQEPPEPNGMQDLIRDALQSGDRAEMISLAALLDAANNGVGGCPLN